ncbi:YD repeat-containing protein, partial [Chryseobacterium taichungense]
MKNILIIGGLLLSLGQLSAQSISPTDTKNYIYTKNCLDADCVKKAETVQYFDGLGRPKQTIAIKASPSQKDVVSHIEYDQYGRQSKSFLPVPQTGTQNGAFYENALANATNPDIYGTEKIYAEQIIENAPLTRVKKSYNVGNAWADKPVTYNYNTNTSATEVKKFAITTTWVESRTDSQLNFPGTYYPVNSLMKTAVTDEDNNTTTEYRNGKGQTVLIRKNDGTQNVDTYYVYNEYNQLAFVIPPLAAAKTTIDETTRNSLCYQYRYDEFGRLVEKRIPGKGWEYLVYDKQDRVVLTQDAMLGTTTNTFTKKGWLFTKYDKFGRVVYTGFFASTATRSAMQTAVNNVTANPANNEERSTTPFTLNGMNVYYTKNAFPTVSMTILSVNYYDTYPPLPADVSIPTQVLGQTVLSQDAQNAAVSTKTLPTASYVKNIENDNWTKDFIWYDEKGRAIGSHSVNHLGGFTKTETLLDFAGAIQKTDTYHLRKQGESGVTVKERFVYDSQNRMLKHFHQVDSMPEELLTENTYNELSELTNKKVGNNLQSIDYAYN